MDSCSCVRFKRKAELMKKRLFFVISVAGFMSYAFAQDEKPVELSVTRVRSEVTANLPQDLPSCINPSHESPPPTGYTFSYLVMGTHIAGIKEDSLVVSKLQMKDGKNVSRTTFRGTPSFKMEHSQGKVSDDGKYALFQVKVTVGKAIATELPIIEGTVDVCIADGTEVHAVKLSDDDNQSYTVGDYTIKILGHDARRMFVQTDGDGAKEGIAGLQVLVKEKEINCDSYGWSPNHRSWTYNFGESLSDVTVNLMLWKNLRTQTVSFQ